MGEVESFSEGPVTITKATVDELPELKPYRVTAENGLVKRGTQFAQGDLIDLDEDTAARSIAAGDVEEI